MGIFIEDIQMYCLRNREINIVQKIDKIIQTDLKHCQLNSMRHILRGRILWCASTCSEILSFPSEDNDRIKLQIIDMSIRTLK